MNDLQELTEALETSIFVDIALPIEERRHQAKVVATLKRAARLVADPNDDAIERAAKAIFAVHSATNWTWDKLNPGSHHEYRTQAKAAIAALTPPGDTE